MTRVIATRPPVELVDQRDDHTRVWEIVKEVETTHPDGSTTVDTVKSHIHEKGSGLCYKDATGNYVPSVAEWRETPDGYVIDRCAYGLAIGRKVGAGMGYKVEGHELALRPSYLMLSDGLNEAHLALLNPDVEGFIADGKPSVVRFPAAFGPGYDLEYVAEKGGFHQNVIIAAPPQVPAGLDPASATIYLYTEMNLDEYLAGSGCEVSIEGEPVDTSAPDFISPASRGGSISFRLVGQDPEELGRRLHAFGVSKVTDCPTAGGIPRGTLAEKRLVKDPHTSAAYLCESLPVSYFFEGPPAYPVVWDYVQINSDITTDARWEGDTTYWVSASISVTATLTIEEGAIVKLNPYTKISISEGGKVIAEGEPPEYVVFTKAADNDYGEQIQAPDGQYMTALQLVGGSQPGSVIQYCSMRYGVCGVDCLQSLNNSIAHNVLGANGAQRDMWFGINVQYDVDVACRNNLVRSCSYYGIYYYDASANDIRNNTVHDCGCGINLTYTSCDHVKDNLLTSCGTGIGANYGTLTVDYNGYWDCETNISGKSMGANSVDLGGDEEDNPYAEEAEFFLDQSCDLIDAGSGWAPTPLDDPAAYSTCQYAKRDVGRVDIGYHYAHYADSDADTMPDVWEEYWNDHKEDPQQSSFSTQSDDGNSNFEPPTETNDELANKYEFMHGTNPYKYDTDADGYGDNDEVGEDTKGLLRGWGPALYDFMAGPWLTNVTSSGISIGWWVSSQASDPYRYAYYKKETDANFTELDQNDIEILDHSISGKVYEVGLTQLSPDTVYQYYVVSTVGGSARTSPICRFRTLESSPSSFGFVAYGDNRGCADSEGGHMPGHNDNGFNECAAQVARGMLSEAPEAAFVLHVGDYVNSGSDAEHWRQHFFLPSTRLLAEYPLFAALGNHEHDPGDNYFDDFFDFPGDPNDATPPFYYHFDYGDCRFICLDTNEVEYFEEGSPEYDEYDWLEERLGDGAGKRIFVWFHHPPFSSGSHGQNASDNGRAVRDELVDLFQEYGIKLVAAGHDHIYERAVCSEQSNAVHYVVTGGAGAPLRTGELDYTYPPDERATQEELYDKGDEPQEDAFHFCVVEVPTSGFTLKVYKWNGDLKDQWP